MFCAEKKEKVEQAKKVSTDLVKFGQNNLINRKTMKLGIGGNCAGDGSQQALCVP